MKVFGIGVDLVKIKRIQNILLKPYCLRFLTKVLHKKQLEHYKTLKIDEYQAQYVASRWAAKQATVKALGRRQLVFSQTLIQKDTNGKPYVILQGVQNKKLKDQLKITEIHISLAHEDQFAVAYSLAMCNL